MTVAPSECWATDPPAAPRTWRLVALLLRLLCAILLVCMFGIKVRDFLQEPVATSIREEPSSLPFFTVCPVNLNWSVLTENFNDWRDGNVTTDAVLSASALELSSMLDGCTTRDGRSCRPSGASGEFSWGRWRRSRYPPGVTCYTLETRLDPAGNSEIRVSLRLHGDTSGSDGFYRVFVHGPGTRAKTYYGGGMVSTYFMVSEASDNVELVLALSETVLVDRRQSPCRIDPGYDQNQCLQDCRSRAAFLAANCSVQWGSPPGDDVPSCRRQSEYYRLLELWESVDPECSCPRNCVVHETTLSSHQAMVGAIGETLLRVLEERRTYQLVDLLTDLGGTTGLLLGYSLSSLVDVGDWLVHALAAGRRRR
ncbi:hypothetical protein FJT64_013066 [Amphibalanus amphitrite]|uniref:Uncharacterized protein n=1 Tax=Amphibalanus amphitrite TaxID=1232801 RepID=A0A6A4V466_AMPAM|nr:hypothetical protein FJT64_013066 [Amphibalanus amphitrite]